MASSFKAMKSAARQLQANLLLAGHPNQFPSKPVASKMDWDRVQDMHYRTLLCTNVHVGSRAAWEKGIASIYGDEVKDTRSLLSGLANAERTIHPTTDATVLLMPTQKLLKLLLLDDPDINDAALIAEVRTHSAAYVSYYIQGRKTNTVGRPYTLDEALLIYETFHVLESHDARWSKSHLFKCNCDVHFKRASCSHCLLAGMACDARIKLPSQYRGDTVQQRRKRGRPSSKGTEIGDEGEARARERIALQKEYVMPQVNAHIRMSCCMATNAVDDRRDSMPKLYHRTMRSWTGARATARGAQASGRAR